MIMPTSIRLGTEISLEMELTIPLVLLLIDREKRTNKMFTGASAQHQGALLLLPHERRQVPQLPVARALWFAQGVYRLRARVRQANPRRSLTCAARRPSVPSRFTGGRQEEFPTCYARHCAESGYHCRGGGHVLDAAALSST